MAGALAHRQRLVGGGLASREVHPAEQPLVSVLAVVVVKEAHEYGTPVAVLIHALVLECFICLEVSTHSHLVVPVTLDPCIFRTYSVVEPSSEWVLSGWWKHLFEFTYIM